MNSQTAVRCGRGPRHPPQQFLSAAWALAEATARTSEIPQVRVSNVDPSHGRVWLHGSNRAEARLGSSDALKSHAAEAAHTVLSSSEGSDPLLVYQGSRSTEVKCRSTS